MLEVQRVAAETGEVRSVGWSAIPLFRRATAHVRVQEGDDDDDDVDPQQQAQAQRVVEYEFHSVFGRALRLPLFKPPVLEHAVNLSSLTTLTPTPAALYLRILTHTQLATVVQCALLEGLAQRLLLWEWSLSSGGAGEHQLQLGEGGAGSGGGSPAKVEVANASASAEAVSPEQQRTAVQLVCLRGAGVYGHASVRLLPLSSTGNASSTGAAAAPTAGGTAAAAAAGASSAELMRYVPGARSSVGASAAAAAAAASGSSAGEAARSTSTSVDARPTNEYNEEGDEDRVVHEYADAPAAAVAVDAGGGGSASPSPSSSESANEPIQS